ncbi:MAG: hypothetical protein GSR86_07890 [Desulfurococcales archaeon]|nr:hypothetical protein [Desulfurococcales archaeon]
MAGLRGFLRDLGKVKKIYPDVPSIARRMFVTNSMDGLLAALGVNIGGYSPTGDPMLIAASIMGGGVAMGVMSGMVGVYLSEKAERIREVRELEKKLSSKFKEDSVYWRAARLIPIYVALWSGIGIVLFPTLVAVPYIMAAVSGFSMREAFITSLAMALALMGLLGAYLARISGEDPLTSALRGLGLGVLAAIMVYLLKGVLGAIY